jgi:putative tricarboxylic transport membrane protein
MKKLDAWSSIFWLIISTLITIHSLKLDPGTFYNPGPGFLFFWCGVTLGTFSIIVLLLALTTKKEEASTEKVFENVNWVKIISVTLSLTIYAIIIERLGFLISTVLFIAFLLHSIGTKKWYVVIFIAFVSTFLTYAIFELWLHTRLPKGILKDLVSI